VRVATANRLVRKGDRLRRGNQAGQAEAHYLKALKIIPKYPRAMAGMARAKIQQRNGNEALRWARMLVKAQPKRSHNLVLLGDAYRVAGNKSAARKVWYKAAGAGNAVAKRRLRETGGYFP
jgi:cytochrome c-type biogenesis protein CcmH/NrfG